MSFNSSHAYNYLQQYKIDSKIIINQMIHLKSFLIFLFFFFTNFEDDEINDLKKVK